MATCQYGGHDGTMVTYGRHGNVAELLLVNCNRTCDELAI